MIYMVEIPKKGPPAVWSFENVDIAKEVLRQYWDKHAKCRAPIYEKTTAARLLACFGCSSLEEARCKGGRAATIADLIENALPVLRKTGDDILNTTLYRTYEDEYTTEPRDEWLTYRGWNAETLFHQREYMTDEEALDAVDNKSEWDFPRGKKARKALRTELKRMGVLRP